MDHIFTALEHIFSHLNPLQHVGIKKNEIKNPIWDKNAPKGVTISINKAKIGNFC